MVVTSVRAHLGPKQSSAVFHSLSHRHANIIWLPSECSLAESLVEYVGMRLIRVGPMWLQSLSPSRGSYSSWSTQATLIASAAFLRSRSQVVVRVMIHVNAQQT